MTTTIDLKSIYQSIDPLLDTVQTTVRAQWIDAFQLVYGKDTLPPRLGGKMMRPALCFFSASACGATDLKHFNEMASAMELLHLAALAHDDVVDSADMRRGETSLNRLWDNHTAVLGGDYLVAKALSILTVYDSCPVISSALDSIHQMAEGELMNFGRGKENLNDEDCIRLSEKKTASLFAVSCCTPSLLTNPDYKQPLHDYGMGMGTAFQLIDDLIDLEQDEETMGKPSCGDIVEGKITLPMIYMKEVMDASDRNKFESMHGQPMTDENRSWVREKLYETKAHERIIELCDAYVVQGKTALDALPQSSAIDSMKQIAEFVLIRNA
jgi:geranylgeranyl pyrophosphate synthase